MARDFDTYMKGYQRCKRPWECSVKDLGVRHIDFDEKSMRFFEGKYTMGPIISDCLIEKFLNRSQFESYSLLRNFRHSNVVPVQNFYDVSGYPRFVLSWVDGSLTAWMKKDGAGIMFKSNMKGSIPTGALRQTLLDLCSGLEHLLAEQLYPAEIDLKDMYVRQVGHKGIVQILINKVERLSGLDATKRKAKLWAGLRKALHEIYKEAPRAVNPVALRFINYVGVTDSTRLQRFPDKWDYNMKARYLLSVMSEDIAVVRPKLHVQGVPIINWPKTPNGNRLRAPFQEAFDHQAARGTIYDVEDPYDYIRLCKDVIKHWNVMPASVKGECSTWEKFIDKIEKWDQMIWCTLYEATA